MKKKLNLILIFLCIVSGTIYVTQRNRDVEYTFNNIEKANLTIENNDKNILNTEKEIEDDKNDLNMEKEAEDDKSTKETKLDNEAEQNNENLININTADKETLKTLPKIGDVIAENIIKYREANGEFKDISEIKNVDKIGEKTFELIKDLITI